MKILNIYAYISKEFHSKLNVLTSQGKTGFRREKKRNKKHRNQKTKCVKL